ncbi:MAG: hypothetical protein RIK87_04965 [Fuerstiella sp.]
MSQRFRFCLVLWIAVVLLSALSGKVQAQDEAPPANQLSLTPVPQISDADWTIEIIPARKVVETARTSAVGATVTAEPPAGDAEMTDDDSCGRLHADVTEYEHVYRTIPFNRAEYNANPSYRHDSTMEILTGNARHQTIVRHGSRVRAVPVSQPGGQTVIPYGFVRPSLRLNYYRHFPSLNPYWNIFWNYSGIY